MSRLHRVLHPPDLTPSIINKRDHIFFIILIKTPHVLLFKNNKFYLSTKLSWMSKTTRDFSISRYGNCVRLRISGGENDVNMDVGNGKVGGRHRIHHRPWTLTWMSHLIFFYFHCFFLNYLGSQFSRHIYLIFFYSTNEIILFKIKSSVLSNF